MKKFVFNCLLIFYFSSLLIAEVCFNNDLGRIAENNSDNPILYYPTSSSFFIYAVFYFFSSSGMITSALSGCDFIRGAHLNDQEKEQFYFFVFNKKQNQKEIPIRSGEYLRVAVNALGCNEQKKAFDKTINASFENIFRENEYGLAHAIRINRKLNEKQLCENNNLRKFLTALDEHNSAIVPTFPFVPKSYFDKQSKKQPEQNNQPQFYPFIAK